MDVYRLVRVQDRHDFGNAVFGTANGKNRTAPFQRVPIDSGLMFPNVFSEKTAPQSHVLVVDPCSQGVAIKNAHVRRINARIFQNI
jgi:hypothetical protein